MKPSHPHPQSTSPLMRQNRQGQWLAMLVLMVGVLMVIAGHSWRGQQQQRLTQAKQTARLANQQLNNLQAWQQRLPAIGLYERQSLASPLTAQAVTVALAKLRQDPNVQQLRPQLGDLMVGAARYPLEDQLDGTTEQSLKLNAFKLQLAVKTVDDLQGRQVVMTLASQLPGFVIPLQLTQKPLLASDKSPALVDSQWQLLLIGLADPLPAWPALAAASQAGGSLETQAKKAGQDGLAPQFSAQEGDRNGYQAAYQGVNQGIAQGMQRPLLSPEAVGLADPRASMAPPSDQMGGGVGVAGARPMTVSAILYLSPERWSFWLNGQKYDSSSPSIQLGDWQLLTVSAQSVLWQHSVDGRLLKLSAGGSDSPLAPMVNVVPSTASESAASAKGLRPVGYHPMAGQAILPPPPPLSTELSAELATELPPTLPHPSPKPQPTTAKPKSSTPKETAAPKP
jgi:type II secretory pathway pseudopilin PulG